MNRRAWLFCASTLAACAGSPKGAPAPPAAVGEKAALPDPAPPPRADGRLPGGVAPLGYRIELTLDPKQASFLGRVQSSIRIERPTRVIVLHARSMRVALASVRFGTEKLWGTARLRPAAGSKGDPEELVLTFERELPAGTAELSIEYEAGFGSGLRGAYRVEDGGASYVFTKFEPTDARLAFPCFDEPSFKVPVQLSISAPPGNRVFSNMPLARSAEQPASQLVTHEFEPSPPLPTYLIAFGVGPFDVLEGDQKPVPLRVIAPRGRAALGRLALETAGPQLELLSRYFGSPHPYKKLDLVSVPNFAAGAMENAGFITFREELLLADEKRVSSSTRRALEGVLAHELAHQWFGNLVTMSWWDDLWLNEAFATWMGTKIVDQHHPALGAGRQLLGRKSKVMRLDALPSARKIRQPVRSTSDALEAFDGITYFKGASVLEMLERWLGEDAFRQGIRLYLERHRWKNASSADLFAALESASGRQVQAVMDGFIGQSGLPLVSAELDCKARTLGLRQDEYRLLGDAARAPAKRWTFPACVLTGGEPAPICRLLNGESAELPLGKNCPAHIYPNAGYGGYYRTRLSQKALLALSKVAGRSLGENERIGFVADAWALVASGDLAAGEYLEFLRGFSADTSLVVWEQIAESLAVIDRALLDDTHEAAFAKRVMSLVGAPARRAGWDAAPNEGAEQRLRRATLLQLAGTLGVDSTTNRQAGALAERWLADPNGVDADIAPVALELHARSGDEAFFDALVKKLGAPGTPEQRLTALAGLVGFEDPKLVERLLGLGLDGTIKAQDLRYVFGPLFERRATRETSYRWLVAHFAELQQKLPSSIVGRTLWVMAGSCDEKRVAEAEQFFRTRVMSIEGAQKHLRLAAEAGRSCAEFAKHHGPALRASLGS